MALSDLTRQWDGYSETYTSSSSGAKIVYTCDWDSRQSLVSSDLLDARHSDLTHLKCTSATVTPLGDADAAGGPQTAKVEATFTPIGGGWSALPIQEIENDWSNWLEHWEGSGEAITLESGFKWDVAPKSDISMSRANAVKIFPTATITLTGTVSNLGSAEKGKILNCIGKINNAATTIKGVSYGTGKLLFLGADLQEGVDSEGNTIYQLTYKFAYRHSNTWNEFWRKDANPPGYVSISADGAGNNPPYDSIAFATNLDPANW